MNISDYISGSLETTFWVKILKFFDTDADPDPGSANLFDSGFGIRDKHPRSATLEERMKIKRRKREAANKGK
jgi:hypothetical protein